MQRQSQVQPFAHDRDQHVGRHGVPDLRLHGVLGIAEEALDAQVLLDPFEKQLNLPALPIQFANSQCWQNEIVREEHQRSALVVAIADAPQTFGIALPRIEDDEIDELITNQAGAAIDRSRDNAPILEVRLGASDKEAAALVQAIQALEVQVAAVHDVEGAGFGDQQVEYVDVVQFAVADVYKCRNGATQVEQGVHLDRRLGLRKPRPREQRQTQIDRRGIQRVNSLVEIDGQRIARVQPACDADQRLCKFAMDAPVASFVSVGQGTATDVAADAQMIELGVLRSQAGFDVAQTLAVGQLREGQTQKLIQARKPAYIEVAVIFIDAASESVPRRKLHDLREDKSAAIHEPLPT